jgi:hypothetical protein
MYCDRQCTQVHHAVTHKPLLLRPCADCVTPSAGATAAALLLQLPSGSLLADDMGLGKTVQALGLMLARPRTPGQPQVFHDWCESCVRSCIIQQRMSEVLLLQTSTVRHTGYTRTLKTCFQHRR